MLVGEGGGLVRRRLNSAAVGREEEDGDERVDPELPGPIAGARKKREARRSSWRSSIYSGMLQSTAARRRARARPRAWRRAQGFPAAGEKGGGGGASGRGGSPYAPRGARDAREARGRARRHGGNGASVPRDSTGVRDDRWGPSVRVLTFSVFFQKFQGVLGNCFRPLNTL